MRSLRGLPVACLMVLMAARVARPAPAPARSGLDQLPASASIVFHFRGVQGVRDRLVTMMQNALPDVLKEIQPRIDAFIKDGIEGRKLRGLAKAGPIFIVFTEPPNPAVDPPKMAIVLAVTDYKEFRDNLLKDNEHDAIKVNGNGVEAVVLKNVGPPNAPVYFVNRKGYAVVTPNQEVANSFTKKQPSLDGRMSKEQAATFLAYDMGMFLAMDVLNKEYAQQIKSAREGLAMFLDIAAAQASKAEKGLIDRVKEQIGPLFQAVEDSQGILFTMDFRPGGLALHVESEIRPSSPTAKGLRNARQMAFKELANLPEGKTYYSGMRTSGDLYNSIGSAIVQLLEDKDGKGAEEIKTALTALVAAGPRSRLDATSKPLSGLSVYHYEHPAKAVDAEVKLFQAKRLSEFLKQKPVLKIKAEKHGDLDLNFVELVWDLDKMAEALASGKGGEDRKKAVEGLKSVLGEKLRLWFGSDGKVVVHARAEDWEAARVLLDAYFQGTKTVGAVEAFREVRKEMPLGTSYLGLIDVAQSLDGGAEVLKFLFGNVVPPVAPAEEKPAFVGVSVTLTPQRGSFDLFLSGAAARVIRRAIVKPLIGR